MRAAYWDKDDTALVLIERGADVSLKNNVILLKSLLTNITL
jgi:hypothetical protein